MTRRVVWMILLGLGVIVSAMGIGRLRFDPDFLGMLPPEMGEVRGLKVLHDGFAREDELVVLIEGGEEDVGGLGEAAASLGAALEEAVVVKRARWRPMWEDGDAGMAELLGYFWLNGPEEDVRKQVERFSKGRARGELETSLEEVATAMEGGDLVMRAHDPFGFLAHPSMDLLMEMAEGTGGFESEDGMRHLLLLDAPQAVHGYREAGVWVEDVRRMVELWEQGEGKGLKVSLTGEPAFSSEIGGAMENDMRGTVGITGALIGLLFWLMQRRVALLLGMVVTLGLTFLTTLGLAGWIYGELSVMAAGFAAILIGLAVDYGVLICQESKAAGGGRERLWRLVGPSIVWAAMTTAVVFLALNASGLPGIAQLGTLVACGIGVGAVLMLGIFLPFVARVRGVAVEREVGGGGAMRRAPGWVVVVLLLGTLGVIGWQGFPGVEFDPALMRPRESRAMEAFEKVKAAFPEWNQDAPRLMVEGGTDEEVLCRLAEAERRVGRQAGVAGILMPTGWWPDEGRQGENRVLLEEWLDDRGELLGMADAVGFTEEGTALAKGVMEALVELLGREGAVVYPESEVARTILRLYMNREDGGGGAMAGVVELEPGVDVAGEDYGSFAGLSGGGIWLAGWDLLRPAVAPLIRRDLVWVFLPMAGLMVVMLIGIFRRVGEVCAVIGVMVLAGLVLLAAMRLLGIEWNFLNIAATPLLLGTGIDYGIHVMLALRRSGGDFQAMWEGTGKAVLFCGVTTAIGFGSLCFASNEAMASMGAVAVIGILVSMVLSVFVLPGMVRK
jgi:predicted exporter